MIATATLRVDCSDRFDVLTEQARRRKTGAREGQEAELTEDGVRTDVRVWTFGGCESQENDSGLVGSVSRTVLR